MIARVIVGTLREVNRVIRAVGAFGHMVQYRVEGVLVGSTEWFDHYMDAHWQWPVRRRSLFLERGVMNCLVIRPGARVLELCSGDGFNSRHFYASRASAVLAVDHNASAVHHARRFNAGAGVEYRRLNVLTEFPAGSFDNVVWDAAMQHFERDEIAFVVGKAHAALSARQGVLSGFTEIENADVDYVYTKTVFTGREDVAACLKEFAHVVVIEQPAPTRRSFYFYATDDPARLPFGAADEGAG